MREMKFTDVAMAKANVTGIVNTYNGLNPAFIAPETE